MVLYLFWVFINYYYKLLIMKYLSWKVLSWEKSRLNLFKLQLRILKSVLVGDIKKSFSIQKVLINSRSARLLSIKFGFNNNLMSSSLQDNFSFYKRSYINSLLLKEFFNWNFGSNIMSLSNLCWQELVRFTLSPSYEVNLSPLSFGFRSLKSINFLQDCLLLKLRNCVFSRYFVVMVVDIDIDKIILDFKFILSTLLVPRNLKFSILRFIKCGFTILPKRYFSEVTLSGLLLNIFLDKLIFFLECLQVGSTFLFLLVPQDNKLQICHSLDKSLITRGLISLGKKVNSFSVYNGFDFLGWHFKLLSDNTVFCIPSFHEYKVFLKRVKSIINNSNYGAVFIKLNNFNNF